jgi:succinate dehydrogenase/fumarate reductase iron-sulfur protein
MNENFVKVKIERYDPEKDKKYVESYDVPRGTKARVLDFLNYIFEEVDSSLGYRRHLCKARMCNGCLMMVNDKPRLICWEVISPDQKEITLSPLKGKKIIKDLVVDFEGHLEQPAGEEPVEEEK